MVRGRGAVWVLVMVVVVVVVIVRLAGGGGRRGGVEGGILVYKDCFIVRTVKVLGEGKDVER